MIVGVTPDGTKERVAIGYGIRESKESWRDLLLDLKERGLKSGPLLAIGDGAMGFWAAVNEVYPKTRHQRCWVHKMANVLNALPKSLQGVAKADLRDLAGPQRLLLPNKPSSVFSPAREPSIRKPLKN